MKNIIDRLIFLIFIILISPYLFITGGLARIIRFHNYTIAVGTNDVPKRYYY